MRALALLYTVLALFHPSYSIAEPYTGPVQFLDTAQDRSLRPLLVKRQSCPSDTTSCSDLGDDSACCPSGTVCARDQTGQIACCPSGAVCVGTLGSGTGSATGSTTPFVLGGTTTQTASPATTAQATLAPGYSTVSNDFYPFILIPSTYANSQLCLSAYTSCQSASTACFNSLDGQNGVTVSGVGTQGLTQAGISGTLAVSASSICSSLSARGCYGLQSTQCSQFGSGTQGPTDTAGLAATGNNARPAVARCTGALYTAAAAAMAGAGVARIVMA